MKRGKKMLVIVCIALALIVIVAVSVQSYTMKQNDIDHGNNQIIYKGGEKNAAVFYQPAVMAKGVDRIAELITNKLQKDGYTVTVNYVGSHIPDDLSEFDIVIWGSPTYMRNISPVAEETVQRVTNYGENSKVSFFVLGMLNNTPELDKIKKIMGDNLDSCAKFNGLDSEIEKTVYDWVESIY